MGKIVFSFNFVIVVYGVNSGTNSEGFSDGEKKLMGLSAKSRILMHVK